MAERWSRWRRLVWLKAPDKGYAARNRLVDVKTLESIPDRPGVYELALIEPGVPTRPNGTVVYKGRAKDLKKRLKQYIASGSQLRALIEWHLGWGWHLAVRTKVCSDDAAAKYLEAKVLGRTDYPWNTHNNSRAILLFAPRFAPGMKRLQQFEESAKRFMRWYKKDHKLKFLRRIELRIAFPPIRSRKKRG